MKEIIYTVSFNSYGDRYWHLNNTLNGFLLNNKLHRANGSAIEHANGNKVWYLNGLLHRIDGPAVEYIKNVKHWYINNKRHRANGPAIEYANGDKYWYLNDKRYNSNNRIFKILSNSSCSRLNKSNS